MTNARTACNSLFFRDHRGDASVSQSVSQPSLIQHERNDLAGPFRGLKKEEGPDKPFLHRRFPIHLCPAVPPPSECVPLSACHFAGFT